MPSSTVTLFAQSRTAKVDLFHLHGRPTNGFNNLIGKPEDQ